MVMCVAIDKYLQSHDKEELVRVINLVQFHDNVFGQAKLYKDLLLSILDDNGKVFIGEMIEAMREEPYLYDEEQRSNFHALQNCSTDILQLLTAIEQQLMSLAYIEAGSDYKRETEEVIDYLLNKKVLFLTIIYKEDGQILKERIVSLFGMGDRENRYML